MKIFLSFIVVLLLAGCVTAESRGNAAYTVRCPVLLPDGTAATYLDENGVTLPVMSEFVVSSGRNLSGGVKVDIPGCVKIDIPKLEQGEDRSAGVTGILRDWGLAVFRIIGG